MEDHEPGACLDQMYEAQAAVLVGRSIIEARYVEGRLFMKLDDGRVFRIAPGPFVLVIEEGAEGRGPQDGPRQEETENAS